MSSLVSTKIAALKAKLRQAEHAGQYFSSEDVAGFIRELAAIGNAAAALEDQLAGRRRAEQTQPGRVQAPTRMPAMHPGAMPIGTFIFVPAGQQ